MNFNINDEKDIFIMKLINYFITKKNYSPIIIHGLDSELWLENPKEEFRIVRIITKNIYNNEQYIFDKNKTKKVLSQIKRRMLIMQTNMLSILVNTGDNLKNIENEKNYITIVLENENDIKENNIVNKYFSNLKDSINYKESGIELINKITGEIAIKNVEESEKRSKMFKKETPSITYFLIIINIILFSITAFVSGNYYSIDTATLYKFGGLVSNSSEYYRIVTSAFLHAGLIHLLCNMYALYIVGSQVEQFFGKKKYIFIYFMSAIMGSLFTVVFSESNIILVGASGAIFGLFGAIIYFGYNYRGYIGNQILSQMIPVVLLNLFIGLTSPNIGNAAHIGGLIGGYISSMALGANLEEEKSQKVNGFIVLIILTAFMIYMGYIK